MVAAVSQAVFRRASRTTRCEDAYSQDLKVDIIAMNCDVIGAAIKAD